MASLEYNEGRWVATTCDADGDETFTAHGPTLVIALAELVEVVVTAMGERDESNREAIERRDARLAELTAAAGEH